MTDPAAPAVWNPRFDIERRSDGTIVMSQREPLGDYPLHLPACLQRWADERPDHTWLAERNEAGNWRRLGYREGLDRVRRIGAGLLGLGLGPDRPVLILSGNSIAHAVLALAAQYVGVPHAAVSPAYSLATSDFTRLRTIADTLRPGLIYAEDGRRYAPAIRAIAAAGQAIAVARAPDPAMPAIRLDDLGGEPGAADAACARIDGDTVAKYLFTSGSTGAPKAVINTQRMLMANQAMVADCYRFLARRPPVLVDWAPWSHTAAGNKVFNMALYHGGSYFIDDGRPTPEGIGRTVRNLADVAPTWYFNVPAGYDMLAAALKEDEALRGNFFARLDMMMYAGAGMARHTWQALRDLGRAATGRDVPLATGLGATETAPFALMCTRAQSQPGNVGVPARGLKLKLVPVGDRFEARLRGPSVTPGYLRAPEATAQAFDDEGYFRLGDALRPADPQDLAAGFFFDGRLAENFKLTTGTWVTTGAVRAALIDAFGGLIRDAVIAGENRRALAALVFLDPAAAAGLARLSPDAPMAEIATAPAVRAALAERLRAHSDAATGSSNRVTRILVETEPPALDRGEITDKGAISQRGVLASRRAAVDRLYSDDAQVIRA